MKKLVSMILTGVLVFSLVGCGSTSSTIKTEESTTEQTVESIVAVTESNKEEITEEKVAEAETPATKVIVDHAGAEVEIPTEINRIVVGNTLP